jgi:hypothetical protein
MSGKWSKKGDNKMVPNDFLNKFEEESSNENGERRLWTEVIIRLIKDLTHNSNVDRFEAVLYLEQQENRSFIREIITEYLDLDESVFDKIIKICGEARASKPVCEWLKGSNVRWLAEKTIARIYQIQQNVENGESLHEELLKNRVDIGIYYTCIKLKTSPLPSRNPLLYAPRRTEPHWRI